MSVSIIILKEIEGFSCADALSSVRRAADRAGLFCAGLEASWYVDPFTGAETECVSGTLCEVCAEEVKARFARGVETRQCGFTIQGPEDSSCDSFTWLIQKKNYFWALDLDYLGGDFEFAFRFCPNISNCRKTPGIIYGSTTPTGSIPPGSSYS